MRREISNRTVALIALGLAVGSAVFCWGWSARQAAEVQRHRREISAMRLRYDEMQYRMVNVAALLLTASQDPSFPLWRVQIDPRLTPYRDVSTSPTFRSIEMGRANQALMWYFRTAARLHATQEGDCEP